MPTLINIFEYRSNGSGFAGTESLTAISTTIAIKTSTSKITIHLAFFSFKVLHPLYIRICWNWWFYALHLQNPPALNPSLLNLILYP